MVACHHGTFRFLTIFLIMVHNEHNEIFCSFPLTSWRSFAQADPRVERWIYGLYLPLSEPLLLPCGLRSYTIKSSQSLQVHHITNYFLPLLSHFRLHGFLKKRKKKELLFSSRIILLCHNTGSVRTNRYYFFIYLFFLLTTGDHLLWMKWSTGFLLGNQAGNILLSTVKSTVSFC